MGCFPSKIQTGTPRAETRPSTSEPPQPATAAPTRRRPSAGEGPLAALSPRRSSASPGRSSAHSGASHELPLHPGSLSGGLSQAVGAGSDASDFSLREWDPAHSASEALQANPHSTLSPRSQMLVGVARWPEAHINIETDASQKDYGLAFSNQSIKLGAQIRSGEIRDIHQLWGRCREWRSSRAVAASDPNAEDFARSRVGDPETFATRYADGERYGFMSERIIAEAAKGERPGMRARVAGLADGGASHAMAATLALKGETVQLTEVVTCTDAQGRPKPLHLADPSTVGKMIHSDAAHLPALLERADEVFQSLKAPEVEPGQRMRGLAELHWLLAHAMPDARGSAAKSELAVRSMAHAAGMELPPFKRGQVPDLEAFLAPKDEFVENYANLFATPSPTQAAASAAPRGKAQAGASGSDA
jgi:avirulence protein